MFYRDNWLIWSYDGIDYGVKKSLDSKFNIRLTKISSSIGSYKDELYKNAIRVRDLFSDPLCLLFSGGIDSEIILRIYRDLKIPINVIIFKYENDLNIREFTQAIKICTNLKVQYNVIDFNLQKFFENDAFDVWNRVYCGSSGWLPHMKFAEYTDDIPIFGSGEPYWVKKEDGKWVFELSEDAHAWSLYHTTVGRTAVCDWYEYSPEIIISHTLLPKLDDLLNNRIYGKLSTNSSKGLFHKEIWSDIDIRPKLVGFEGKKAPDKRSKPEFMLNFEKEYIDNKVFPKHFQYTRDELIRLL